MCERFLDSIVRLSFSSYNPVRAQAAEAAAIGTLRLRDTCKRVALIR